MRVAVDTSINVNVLREFMNRSLQT